MARKGDKKKGFERSHSYCSFFSSLQFVHMALRAQKIPCNRELCRNTKEDDLVTHQKNLVGAKSLRESFKEDKDS